MEGVIQKALEFEATAISDGRASDASILALRDQFATAVLPAIYEDAVKVNMGLAFSNPDWRAGVASEAYKIADELLAARNPQ